MPVNTIEVNSLKLISYGLAVSGFSLCFLFNLNVFGEVWSSPTLLEELGNGPKVLEAEKCARD